MKKFPEPTVSPDCPSELHGFCYEKCICHSEWLKKVAETVDRNWINEEYMPWENA